MGPSIRVTVKLGVGKLGVEQVDASAPLDRSEGELHRGAPRREVRASCDAPRDNYAFGPFDVEVLASDRKPSDIDGEASPRARVEFRMLTHPRRHARFRGQIVEDRGWLRVDLDRCRIFSHDDLHPGTR